MTCRILHVVRGMHAGGIAVWLMQLLRTIDRDRYRMDFLAVADAGPSPYDAEIRRHGSEVIPCPGYRQPWRFARNFDEVMERHGPYDVVHSHVFNYSGFVLKLAARHGVPVRIAHSHADPRLEEAAQTWPKRLYRSYYHWLTKKWLRQYATLRFGVSRLASEALYGVDWAQDERNRVVPWGLDFRPFGSRHDRGAVRQALGIADDAVVIGHVGNYVWHKNHQFLIDVAPEVIAREPRARILLIGHKLRGSDIEAQVRAEGLAEHVLILGPRNDVPRLMTAAMDVFLFPSHYEGLALVLLEAQAAGLPVVLADDLAEESDVVPELMHRLSLRAPLSTWATAVLDAATAPRPITPDAAWARVLASDFNIETSVDNLVCFYQAPDRPEPLATGGVRPAVGQRCS